MSVYCSLTKILKVIGTETSSESLARLQTEEENRAQKNSQPQEKESDFDDEPEVPVKKPHWIHECALKDIKPGSFLLVLLPGRRRLQKFLAQATRIESEDTIYVSFMKQVSGRTFVWPEIEDASAVSFTDVAGIVSDVTPDRRGSVFTTPYEI